MCKQVDIHRLAIAEVGQRAERHRARRFFARNLVAVITRRLENGILRFEIDILDGKVSLVALDGALETLARLLERDAVQLLHRHGRTCDKRTLLRNARHFPVRDCGDASIVRSATRDTFVVGAGTCRHN